MSSRYHKQKLRSVIHKMGVLSVTPPTKSPDQVADKYPAAPRGPHNESTKATLCYKLQNEQRYYISQCQQIGTLERQAMTLNRSLHSKRLRFARKDRQKTLKRIRSLRHQLGLLRT